MDQPLEFKRGDIVRWVPDLRSAMSEIYGDGPFRVIMVHRKRSLGDGRRIISLETTQQLLPEDRWPSSFFELDPFLTAVQKRKQQKTKEEQSK